MWRGFGWVDRVNRRSESEIFGLQDGFDKSFHFGAIKSEDDYDFAEKYSFFTKNRNFETFEMARVLAGKKLSRARSQSIGRCKLSVYYIYVDLRIALLPARAIAVFGRARRECSSERKLGRDGYVNGRAVSDVARGDGLIVVKFELAAHSDSGDSPGRVAVPGHAAHPHHVEHIEVKVAHRL